MNWSKEERETVLRYDPLDNNWYIYTNVPKHWRRLKSQGFELINEQVESNGLLIDATFKCLEKQVSFRAPRKAFNKDSGGSNASILY